VDNPTLAADPPKVYQRHRNVSEEIPAAYLLGNTRLGKLQLQAGVRWERTEVDSEEYDPLPWQEVEVAGYPVNRSTGYATTEDGATYQFKTRPIAHRRGEYDNFFPSITAKYRVTDNLIADVGYTHAISRPNINRIGGLWVFNETTQRITVPNPNLNPETSERIAASLGYYFGAVSSLTVAVTETQIENLVTNTEMSAPEFGITDPEFNEYTVFTSVTGEGKRRFRGLELSYRHHLSFLPGFLSGTSVFGTYTRTYADQRRAGLAPRVATGGIDYAHGRLMFGVRGVWQDDTPWGPTTILRYRKHNLKFDGNIGYKITDRTMLFVQARNILNENSELWEENMLWRVENFGSQWMFGVRGEF
jgi:TonB-dependent receptor